MKKITLFFSLIMYVAVSYSQDTTKYINSGCLNKSMITKSGPPATINFNYSNDSLKITGLIGANCGSHHLVIIEKTQDTIFITTLDTGRLATCYCAFNFEIKIKALATDTLVIFDGKEYNTKGIYAGVHEVEFDNNQVDIYPNPSGGYSKIQMQTGFDISKISISDCQGRPVKTIINQNNEIDITEFQPGLYFIDLEINQQKHLFKKIMKK